MTPSDVPVAFEIAIAGRERSFTREGLYAAGITEEFVIDALDVSRTVEGWVCECDAKVVGAAMGNRTNGEFWVMAVHPDYERRGIGSKLYTLTTDWLRSLGWKEAWLGVQEEIQVNAYSFFKHRGWVEDELRGPFRIMKKSLSDSSDVSIG
jgi:GNAT superfamily N-acetyltransferase